MRGHGAINFEIGTFSLAQFRAENAFMAEPFKLKFGIGLDAVLFAVWAAAFFGTYVGITMHHSTWAERRERTMNNFTNLMFRGYTMVGFDLDDFAREAVWFAKQLEHEKTFSVEEVRKAVEFISLSEAAQKNIGLGSGGKRPILVPSMDKFMIDLAAIIPPLGRGYAPAIDRARRRSRRVGRGRGLFSGASLRAPARLVLPSPRHASHRSSQPSSQRV